jgi:hypothetical protein
MKVYEAQMKELKAIKAKYDDELQARREICWDKGHPNKYVNPNCTPGVPWDSPAPHFCPDCGMGVR